MHWKVCGVTFPVRELAFDLTQCAKDSRCSRRNKHRGTCKVNRKGAMAEEAAAAEAETAEGTKEAELAEQMEQSQANLPQAGLVHPPDLGRGQRACISNQQEVIHAKWRADVNAKLGTFGASLLRVMCITDQMKACNVDALDAVETSLSDEVKSILEERTSQLRDRRYGTHSYVAMLGLLQDTQHNNESLDACTAGSTGPYRCTCAVCTRVCAHESREGRIMETVRSLMKGEDTKLAEGLREEMSTWKNSLQVYQAESERDGDTTLFTAVQFNDGTKHNMIQEFADNVDWFTAFGVQDNEIASCCVCGGPAHDAQSGYCRSKSLRYIKECLSGLLGTPEVSKETGGLAIQTTKFNGSAWRALLIAGCGHDDNILPLYTACAWGKKGAQIRKWGVGHSCLTKEYGFLAQMKEAGLAAAPAGKANFAIVDMYMMKELELEHELAIPYSVSISHDLCNEEWLTQIVLREQMTTNTGKCKESCRCDEIHRVYHDDPNRTFNIGQTAMLTLNGFPEVGRAQSVSYGGDGKNAMEGMHHKGAVIDVGELKDSDIETEMKKLVRTLTDRSQDRLYFDVTAPRVGNSVNPRMDGIGTRAPGANLINGLDIEVEREQSKGELGEYAVIKGAKVVRCSNLGCTEHCTIVLDSDGFSLAAEHKDECMNRVSADGNRRYGMYNFSSWTHDEIDGHHNSGMWELEMSNTGNAPSAKDQLRLYALQTAITDILDEQNHEQRADGRERTCPDQVDGNDLASRAAEHLRHIYADVRGDKEGCNKMTGRGPKCDVYFKAKRDGGATGLICGDCGSKVEIMPEGLRVADKQVCSNCNEEVNEENPAIACTQQQCRSREWKTCRQCCVQSFNANHYYQDAYQPKGSVPLKWKGYTVEQWPNRKKKATSVATVKQEEYCGNGASREGEGTRGEGTKGETRVTCWQ